MADSKVTALTELTSLATGDVIYIVDDPGGTPISKKITVDNFFNTIPGNVTIDGDVDLTGTATNHLLLPINNDATTPTLAFGDGDTGFYEGVDDSIRVAIAGVKTWIFDANKINGENGYAGTILFTNATATGPVLTFRDDQDTGLGRADADQLSLIAGGVEGIRITENTTIKVDIKGSLHEAVDSITATDAGVAASVATGITLVTTNGDSDLDNVTLADGTTGQTKTIVCEVEGNAGDTWKITPANMVGGTQITFAGAGEGCTLVWSASGWIVSGNNGGTIS